jgi:hypothetical protein
MAYDAARFIEAEVEVEAPSAPPREDLRRTERLVVLVGATALGALMGFTAALAMGRMEWWMSVFAAAPFFVLALYLTAQTLRDALARNATGCSTAAAAHAAALLAWPLASLFIPIGALNFVVAPALALATLVLFASCSGGPALAMYRVAAQGALVAALAAHQSVLVMLN